MFREIYYLKKKIIIFGSPLIHAYTNTNTPYTKWHRSRLWSRTLLKTYVSKYVTTHNSVLKLMIHTTSIFNPYQFLDKRDSSNIWHIYIYIYTHTHTHTPTTFLGSLHKYWNTGDLGKCYLWCPLFWGANIKWTVLVKF
jgi:hypothetical protein